MKKLSMMLTLVLLIAGTALSFGAENEETALSWQKQANDTRATVMGVYAELEKSGDKGNAAAKDLITDAVAQLGQGDKHLKKGDEAFAKQEWEKANYGYNMAWQYYVKAATAGLNAKSILAGQ